MQRGLTTKKRESRQDVVSREELVVTPGSDIEETRKRSARVSPTSVKTMGEKKSLMKKNKKTRTVNDAGAS